VLTDKKRQFAEMYVLQKNATQAAIGAGYSPKTAYSQGSRLLKDAEVSEYIAGITAAAQQRLTAQTNKRIATLSEVMGFYTEIVDATKPNDDPRKVKNGLTAARGLQDHYEGDRGKQAPLNVQVLVQMLNQAQPGQLGKTADALLIDAEPVS